MRYNRLDVNLLVALDVLLIEKNVTRAAARLNMTQSSMSGILARLRDYFDDPLVIQFGRRLELSPLAESLVEPVHDVVLRIDSITTVKPEFDPALGKRSFSIVASDYVLEVLMLKVLETIHREAPGIRFEFQHVSTASLDQLEAGEIDFLVTPDHLLSADHPSVKLFSDSFSIIASDHNQYIGDKPGMDDYLSAGHVIYRHGKAGYPTFDRWFEHRYGDVRRVEVVAHTFDLIPKFIINTDRIATVHSRVGKQYVERYGVRMLELPFATPDVHIAIQWHRYREADLANLWVRNKIIELASLIRD